MLASAIEPRRTDRKEQPHPGPREQRRPGPSRRRAVAAAVIALGGVLEGEAVLLLQDPLVAARVDSFGKLQWIFGIWKLKQCFFGAQARVAACRSTLASGIRTALGEAKPQVVQLSSCPPAMLTLQNPRARARLRLNVKGFNMGENAP